MLKRELFDTFQARLRGRYDEIFATEAYRWITSVELSNAVVDLHISYSGELERFEELLDRYHGSIPTMLQALRAIRPAIEERGMEALDSL